jgi:hypothetical protein
MLKTIYINRLKQTLNDIKKNLDHWDQESWHCGTTHCFAGFADARLRAKGFISFEDALDGWMCTGELSDKITANYFGLSRNGWFF